MRSAIITTKNIIHDLAKQMVTRRFRKICRKIGDMVTIGEPIHDDTAKS